MSASDGPPRPRPRQGSGRLYFIPLAVDGQQILVARPYGAWATRRSRYMQFKGSRPAISSCLKPQVRWQHRYAGDRGGILRTPAAPWVKARCRSNSIEFATRQLLGARRRPGIKQILRLRGKRARTPQDTTAMSVMDNALREPKLDPTGQIEMQVCPCRRPSLHSLTAAVPAWSYGCP